MKHVFVETNWVVEYGAPAHLRVPVALALAESAEAGNLKLYIPSVCLTEAQGVIRKKFQPRSAADAVRQYVDWAKSQPQSKLTAAKFDSAFQILDQYESTVRAELDTLEDRLLRLRGSPGIEVFALNDDMLQRAVELSTKNLNLYPFDQAILAAVLVRTEMLRRMSADDISFCERDGDLQPWDKSGTGKQPLKGLYDDAGVWVYGDFTMQFPPRRPGFPNR